MKYLGRLTTPQDLVNKEYVDGDVSNKLNKNDPKFIGNITSESSSSGAKAFQWTGYSFNSSTGKPTFVNSNVTDTSLNIVVGDRVSIKADYSWSFFGTVYSVTIDATNGLQLVISPYTPVANWPSNFTPADQILSDKGYLWFPDKPDIGNYPIGGGSAAFGDGCKANEQGAIAVGKDNIADGRYSIVGGRGNEVAYASFAQGQENKALGLHTAAIGYGNTVNAKHSTAFGASNTVSGQNASGIGYGNKATESYAIAINKSTEANGRASFSEGEGTIANGANQHTAGKFNVADSASLRITGNGTDASHRKNVEQLTSTGDLRLKGDVYVGCNDDSTGGTKLAKLSDIPDVSTKMDKVDPEGSGRFQFGENVSALSQASIAQGSGTTAGGKAFTIAAIGGTAANRQLTLDSVSGLETGMLCSVYVKDVDDAKTTNIDGFGAIASISGNVVTFNGGFSWDYPLDSEQSSHLWVVGRPDLGTRIIGEFAMALGRDNIAQNEQTLVTGRENVAAGKYAVVNGRQNNGIGYATHVEGRGNTVNGMYASADGRNHTVGANYARAIGYKNIASGDASFAEGSQTKALYEGSHAEGLQTETGESYQHVAGKYNVRAGGARVTGWGTSTARKNIEVLKTNGNLQIAGKMTVGLGPTSDMDLATKKYVDDHDLPVGRYQYQNFDIYSFESFDGGDRIMLSSSDATILQIGGGNYGMPDERSIVIYKFENPNYEGDSVRAYYGVIAPKNELAVKGDLDPLLLWTNPDQSAGMGAATVTFDTPVPSNRSGMLVVEFAMTSTSNEFITFTLPFEPFASGTKRYNVIADYSAFSADSNARGRQIVALDANSIRFGTGYQNGTQNAARIVPTRIWLIG